MRDITAAEEIGPVMLVMTMARALVQHPASVEVLFGPTTKGGVLTLRCARQDLGRLIGIEGRISRALRLIVGASGQVSGKVYDIIIDDKQEGTPAFDTAQN